jgi:hypothetical protein
MSTTSDTDSVLWTASISFSASYDTCHCLSVFSATDSCWNLFSCALDLPSTTFLLNLHISIFPSKNKKCQYHLGLWRCHHKRLPVRKDFLYLCEPEPILLQSNSYETVFLFIIVRFESITILTYSMRYFRAHLQLLCLWFHDILEVGANNYTYTWYRV